MSEGDSKARRPVRLNVELPADLEAIYSNFALITHSLSRNWGAGGWHSRPKPLKSWQVKRRFHARQHAQTKPKIQPWLYPDG